MPDPFDRPRFAAAVARKLEGISHRRAVEAFPALNVAMLNRAKHGQNLTVGSFLVVCKFLRLRPLDFLDANVKRRRVTKKTLRGQTVTACEQRETP